MTGFSEFDIQKYSTLQALDDPLLVADEDLQMILVNQAFEKWRSDMGLDIEVVGKRIHDVFKFLDKEVFDEYKYVFETGETVRTTERLVVGGHLVDAETSKIPVFSEGKIVQVITVIRDVTERAALLRNIRESELKYRTAFKNLDDAVLLINLDGIHIQANQKAADLLGYNVKELQSLSFWDLIDTAGTADVSRIPMRLLEGEVIPASEVLFRKKDKSTIAVDFGIHLARDENENPSHFQGILRESSGENGVRHDFADDEENICPPIKDAPKVRQTRIDLETSYRDLELYASLLQHDLRGDLQVILAEAQSALMSAEKGSAVELRNQTIESSTLRMIRFLDAFSKPTRAVESDLVQLIRSLSEIAETTHDGLKIAIKVQNQTDAVIVNAGRLLPMVFSNLFRNAYIYSNKRVEVEVIIDVGPSSVVIDVCDNGPGIHEDVIDRIFEKGASTSGGGYGLHLSRKVIEGYDGTMELLSSENGNGASFRIILPIG